MTGKNDPDGPNVSGNPKSGTGPTAAPGRTPDADLSASDKNEADWAGRPENDGKTVKVGARDVDRPVEPLTETETRTAGGALHDRLARRDRTPVDDGGSSSLA